MGESARKARLSWSRFDQQLGATTSEALRGFDQYTPAQQDLFRLGFARHLMDMAANRQTGGAIANQFTTKSVRDIIENLYPKSNSALWDQGQRLLKDINREAITTRTTRDVLAGARSAELKSDMDKIMEPVKAGADLVPGRWSKSAWQPFNALCNSDGSARCDCRNARSDRDRSGEYCCRCSIGLIKQHREPQHGARQLQALVKCVANSRQPSPLHGGQSTADQEPAT